MRFDARTKSLPVPLNPVKQEPNRQWRVLIVNEVPNVHSVHRTILESAGYAVDETGEARTAWDRLSRPPADVVVLESGARDGVGIEFLRRLRDAGDDVPVVIASAHVGPVDVVAATSLGVIDFLFTPADPKALKAFMAEVIRRHHGPGAETPISPEDTAARIADLFNESLTRAKQAMNHRDFPRAEQFLRQAIALDQSSVAAQSLLGVIHESRDDWGQATRCYEAAYRTDPRQEFARLNMIRAYNRE